MSEIKDLGFGVIEIFDKDTQYAPAQSIKIGNHTYIREDLINKSDLQHRVDVVEKALELACKYNIPDNHITLRFEDGVQIENWQELKEYALQQAEKELKGK